MLLSRNEPKTQHLCPWHREASALCWDLSQPPHSGPSAPFTGEPGIEDIQEAVQPCGQGSLGRGPSVPRCRAVGSRSDGGIWRPQLTAQVGVLRHPTLRLLAGSALQ